MDQRYPYLLSLILCSIRTLLRLSLTKSCVISLIKYSSHNSRAGFIQFLRRLKSNLFLLKHTKLIVAMEERRRLTYKVNREFLDEGSLDEMGGRSDSKTSLCDKMKDSL
ncbi:hypothetical protein ATANTOWER_028500, partial [Ataeniobius toweri]|nr:hypothetical protein [Ataeniobius toweri]